MKTLLASSAVPVLRDSRRSRHSLTSLHVHTNIAQTSSGFPYASIYKSPPVENKV